LTSAVEWLHNAIQIAHRDIFDGNVMLFVSSSSSKAAFEMPTVVLIDFDNAAFQATEVQKGDDRAFVYELAYSLGSKTTGRVDEESGSVEYSLEKGERWWAEFMKYVYENKHQGLWKERLLRTSASVLERGSGKE
jgi:serine/threonine protein kinase